MKRTFLTLVLVMICGTMVAAQTSETSARGTARSATAVSNSGKAVNIQSGTQLTAQLENTLDARKAKVGDRVVLKTTEAIKANGQTVVGKGARLTGRVTEVQQRTRANGESHIGLVFDRLEKGSLVTPISATISSIAQIRARGQSNNDDLFGPDPGASSRSSASTSRQARGGSSSGGLLGGVGSAVGDAVNTTTSAVGGVAGDTTAVVGNTAGDLTRSVGGIRITQSSNASAEGGAVLTLQGGNLRLEQGTSFRVVLHQSAAAGNNQ
jgi:hypothetical protein